MVVNLTCIGCPMGCALKVEIKDNQVESITGHECKIGERYGEAECTNPTRVVTSTVVVQNGEVSMLPVKTNTNIPKDKVFESVALLKDIKLQAPVHIGDIVVENILGTGANFIATRTIEALN